VVNGKLCHGIAGLSDFTASSWVIVSDLKLKEEAPSGAAGVVRVPGCDSEWVSGSPKTMPDKEKLGASFSKAVGGKLKLKGV
jgi:hypothetical protein